MSTDAPMLKSIVSAVDFSDQSRLALRWAGALAGRFGSRLTVVTVIEPLLAEAARIRLGRDLAAEESESALREFIAGTWPSAGGTPVPAVSRIRIGEPARAILECARAEDADVIVMGTQGLSGLQKWLLGSTTERVLRRTPVPVLAVPGGSGSDAASADGRLHLSHVVAATDLSEASTPAATMAAALSARLSARLTLAHVVAPLVTRAEWQSLVQDSNEARLAAARTRLETYATELCGDRRCETVVTLGRPVDAIGSIAREQGAQLIVMGLTGDRGMFSSRPGSTAYHVLSSNTLPVLVVPAAGADPVA